MWLFIFCQGRHINSSIAPEYATSERTALRVRWLNISDISETPWSCKDFEVVNVQQLSGQKQQYFENKKNMCLNYFQQFQTYQTFEIWNVLIFLKRLKLNFLKKK